MEIIEKKDYYLLSLDFIGNPIKVILKPLSSDLAVVAGEGRFMGEELVFRRGPDGNANDAGAGEVTDGVSTTGAGDGLGAEDILEYSGLLFRKE